MPSQSGQPSERESGLRAVVVALLVFVLAVAAYAPTFEGPFVWDDEALVLRKEVTELQPLAVYFARPFWLATDTSVGATYYRPITVLSLALDHAVHGENPTGFHLTNLLLHGLCTILVLSLGRQLGASLAAALVGALLFAWFPRLSEAVGWISGRTDLLATFFSLLALLVTLGKHRRRAWIAGVLLLLGLLSKEVALGAALAVVYYEWQSGRGAVPRERLLRLLPLTLAALLYAGLRLRVLGPGLHGGDTTMSERVLASLEALGRYGAMLVDGWHPRLNIGHLGSPAWPYVALGGALVLALAVASVRWKPEANQALLVLAGLFSLALVLHLIPYQSTVSAADRFLYLPIAAWTPVLASGLSKARRPVALGLALVLAASYLPLAWQRAKVWGDDIRFWGTAVREQEPHYNALSHAGLASILANSGMYEEALVVYGRMQPGDRATYLAGVQRHASLLATNAETDRIVAVLERAARLQSSPSLAASLAAARRAAGEREAGRIAQPRPVGLAQKLAWGRQLAEAGRYRVAMAEFMALIADPGMTSQELRGILVLSLSYGSAEEVHRLYERLLVLDPSTPAEFSWLVGEHNQRTRRLRKLCRELGIEVAP